MDYSFATTEYVGVRIAEANNWPMDKGIAFIENLLNLMERHNDLMEKACENTFVAITGCPRAWYKPMVLNSQRRVSAEELAWFDNQPKINRQALNALLHKPMEGNNE